MSGSSLAVWQRTRSSFVSLGSLASLARGVALAFVVTALTPGTARADDLSRSEAWSKASNILLVSSAAFETLMPRVFYADPEVTVGWKARWHVSVLAPAMTLTTLALINEHHLKQTFKGNRPGCDDTTAGLPECSSYGMLSTQSFGGFAVLGQGAGVFLIDTIKWSNGNFNVGSFVGNIGVPLVLGTIATVGRTAGNWETGGQAWGSAGIGLLSGLGTGLIYAALQRPECGYSGNLVCW